MQWKLCLKKREQTGESELGIVISPRRFWKHVLRPKVTTVTAGKPWKEDDTKVVLSVTDRKTANTTKRYPKLEVEWKYVSKKLQEWSKFLAHGKKMTVTVTFYYQSVDVGRLSKVGQRPTSKRSWKPELLVSNKGRASGRRIFSCVAQGRLVEKAPTTAGRTTENTFLFGLIMSGCLPTTCRQGNP
jgi:hypothetical protein